MQQRRFRSFEVWMLANAVSGAATASFLVLLVPPLTVSAGGTAGLVGIYFALVGLAGLASPSLLRLVRRTHHASLAFAVSVLAIGVAFLIPAGFPLVPAIGVIFSVVLGVALIVQAVLGSAFAIAASPGAGVRSLSLYTAMYPTGQCVGALALAVADAFGVPFRGQALIAALLSLGVGVVVIRRLVRAGHLGLPPERPARPHSERATRPRMSHVIYLLCLFTGTLASFMAMSQSANLMPQLFGYSEEMVALLVGGIAVGNIAIVLPMSTLLTRTGGGSTLFVGTALRGIGALGLALALLLRAPLLAGIGLLVLGQAQTVLRLAVPAISARGSSSVSESIQLLGRSYSSVVLGGVVGVLLTGLAADLFGYPSVVWIAALMALIALVCGAGFLTLTRLSETRDNTEGAPANRDG
jgi:hypothetical protein